MSSSSGMEDIGGACKEIIVCHDRDELGRQAAAYFARLACEAANRRGRVAVALAGGSTPRILYQCLASPIFVQKIPWKAIHLFWGDERFVPPDHPDSNYRMTYETLISKASIPKENVHRMPTEKGDPQAAADEYEEILRTFFGLSQEESQDRWPRFDLVLLGVGADGHTASLFPGSSVLQEKRRWVAVPYVEKLHSYRLTLTLPVFNHAEQVIFLMSGEEKAQIAKALLADLPGRSFPARLIRPLYGKRIFFLDRSAASLIRQKRG